MGVVRGSVAIGGKKRAHTQVWEDKYASVLKSNGWGGNGGKKWPKNWREREEATAELDRILGRQVLVQLAAKKTKEG